MVVIVSISKLNHGRIHVGVAKPQLQFKAGSELSFTERSAEATDRCFGVGEEASSDALHRNTRFRYVTQKDLLPGVWQVAQTIVTCLVNSPELPVQTMRIMR
jgi:hypothetical protein